MGAERADRAPSTRVRRHDPERRERIISACLDVVAERGVAGTSHRRVAAAADVPLGSMTYHFSGMEELLREAFGRVVDVLARRFAARLDAAPEGRWHEAVVDHIVEGPQADRREQVLTHELYTLAVRDAGFRDLTSRWLAESRTALEAHTDPVTARLLDAFVEGISLHRTVEDAPLPRADVARAVRRIVGA